MEYGAQRQSEYFFGAGGVFPAQIGAFRSNDGIGRIRDGSLPEVLGPHPSWVAFPVSLVVPESLVEGFDADPITLRI